MVEISVTGSSLAIRRSPRGARWYRAMSLQDSLHPEHQRRKPALPSDDPTTLKRVRRELTTPRVMRYEDRSQRFLVTSESRDGDRLPAGEDVDIDADSSVDEIKNFNDVLMKVSAFN